MASREIGGMTIGRGPCASQRTAPAPSLSKLEAARYTCKNAIEERARHFRLHETLHSEMRTPDGRQPAQVAHPVECRVRIPSIVGHRLVIRSDHVDAAPRLVSVCRR